MRKLLLILLFTVLSASSVISTAQRRNSLTPEERQKYLTEMRNQKHEFLAKELELTREQQNEFFTVYDQMDDELTRIGEEIRQLEAKVTNDPTASDTEIESTARAIFEQKTREGAVEMEYFAKFKQILKPRQLLGLKNAERKFTQQLVRQHGRMQRN